MEKTNRNVLTEMMNEKTECVLCRIMSSAVMLFSGLFLIQHRRNFGRINEVFQTGLGFSLVALAGLRAMDLPPFGNISLKDFKLEERDDSPTPSTKGS